VFPGHSQLCPTAVTGNRPVCMEANTPHELKTHESINPDEKQQNRIGIDVSERLTFSSRRRSNLLLLFSGELAWFPFTFMLNRL
jgi:hypothetical protein